MLNCGIFPCYYLQLRFGSLLRSLFMAFKFHLPFFLLTYFLLYPKEFIECLWCPRWILGTSSVQDRQVLPAPWPPVMGQMPVFRAKGPVCRSVWSDWHALTYLAIADSGSWEPTSRACNLVLETGKSLFPPLLIGHHAGEGPRSWMLVIWDPKVKHVLKHEFPHFL